MIKNTTNQSFFKLTPNLIPLEVSINSLECNQRRNDPTPTEHNNNNHEKNPLTNNITPSGYYNYIHGCNQRTNNITPTGCNNNSHRLSWRNLWDKNKTYSNPEGVAQFNWRNL
jgi:hypothetical protein